MIWGYHYFWKHPDVDLKDFKIWCGFFLESLARSLWELVVLLPFFEDDAQIIYFENDWKEEDRARLVKCGNMVFRNLQVSELGTESGDDARGCKIGDGLCAYRLLAICFCNLLAKSDDCEYSCHC